MSVSLLELKYGINVRQIPCKLEWNTQAMTINKCITHAHIMPIEQ